MDGVAPRHAVLRAFCDVIHEVSMPLDEPLRFLDAMEQDLTVTRYATYSELRNYMRGSANAVGLMMCHLLDVKVDSKVEDCASALGEAMQLTSFLRDLREDMRRGRTYIPSEDLKRFYGAEDAILREEVTPPFIDLMKFEIERARVLYSEADAAIPLLPRRARRAVKLVRVLYSQILDRIEERGYDVFTKRARTTRLEKAIAVVKITVGLA